MTRGVLALVLAGLLAGCVSLGNRDDDATAVVHYVLNDRTPATAPAPLREGAPLLLVLDTSTGGFYETDQMVYSRSAGTRGYYQFARWTERPGKRFAGLMRARLDRDGRYRVAAAGGYVRGELLLQTELVDFYHDARSAPGVMRLVLRAEVVDLGTRALLGHQTFEQEVAVARFDAAGAAEAADTAVSQTLDALADWLASVR